MPSHSRRYYVVYNGEIYNYVELRERLEREGHVFHSTSDTEVLMAAWESWGIASLQRFVGMFAFALLDVQESKVFLVRDFFGIKPLYFTRYRDGIAFASEIPPLLELSGISRTVDPQSLYRYLRFGITDDGQATMFSAISQLPPGHYLEISLGDFNAFEPQPYWKWQLGAPIDLSFEEAAEHLRELFLESVALHLRSDVPVGTALSGGIDSSSIVMAIRHLSPSAEIHTFSFIAKGSYLSEEPFIDVVGQASHAHVHKVIVSPHELVDDLDALIRVQGEPFGSTSIYAQYRVFRLAKEYGVKVMLDGQGADELLGGYTYYGAARVASLIAEGQWGPAMALLRRLSRLPGRKDTWMRVVAEMLPPTWRMRAGWLGGHRRVPAWLNKAWFRDRDVTFSPNSSIGFGREHLRRRLLETMVSSSLPHLLRYEDRNSMAHSIESRVPFLTPAMAQFLLNLPEAYLISHQGISKAVFREAMRGIVPEVVLARKDKIGFATPERAWLQSLKPWVESTFVSGESIPALKMGSVIEGWRRTLTGKQPWAAHTWRCLNLIAWSRLFEVRYD